ncbi:MAG: hypothetical protein K9J17_00585 [Flavobacteriales bacterium]|nr:hypothetical protein [Flavobacteriales bacterium]
MQTIPLISSITEKETPWSFPILEFKKKKKKSCCEKYKRKGTRCGSCPLKGCA